METELRALVVAEMKTFAAANSLRVMWPNVDFNPADDEDVFLSQILRPLEPETMIVHDDGQCEIDGQFWHFNNYMTELETETLKNKGRVIYTLAR